MVYSLLNDPVYIYITDIRHYILHHLLHRLTYHHLQNPF